MIIMIIIVINYFQEDNIFGMNASLTVHACVSEMHMPIRRDIVYILLTIKINSHGYPVSFSISVKFCMLLNSETI